MLAQVINMFSPYGSMYGRSSGGGLWQYIVGAIVGLTLTILLYVLVFPESRKASLNGFFTFIKDFFDMKYLLIEKILKFIYVLNTMTVIAVGFFLLFGRTFLAGLFLMLLGPIAHRIIYEGFMLVILLVKNTMDINNKLGGGKGSNAFDGGFDSFKKSAASVAPAAAPVAPVAVPPAPAAPVAEPVAPAAPTTPVAPTAPAAPAPRICPFCGAPLEEGSIFCTTCGNKVQ